MVGAVLSGRQRIPVRNIWLLLLYASDLYHRMDDSKRAGIEDDPDDIPDLVAEILAHEVERRLSRNLSLGWRRQEAVLNRVRGRIDLRHTESRQLLERGRVACRFDELTIDTPRNRLVRAALIKFAGIVGRSALARRCRSLAARLEGLGVAGERPPRTEVSVDSFGRFDAGDRLMVAAARLAFDLALPNEESGSTALTSPYRGIEWLRTLFERGVAGFYAVTLSRDGWRVNHGRTIHWPQESPSPGIESLLPSMVTDIVLEHPDSGRRIVVDTKFNAILTPGHHRKESLRSGYIYQIYAYLRSQESDGNPLSANAAGLLLHPSVGQMIDESVIIQGHPIRFATVDLSEFANQIRHRLLTLIDPYPVRMG
jgi:5-methylcytosine-specific restriction enzyme subunit McrC